jgi:hypothetical protein
MSATLLAALTVLLGGTAVAGAATRTTVLELPNETQLSAQNDLALVSVRDAATGLYSLQLVRDGRLEPLPVAPSAAEFDADLGTDSAGRPAVVFARCFDPAHRDDPTAGGSPADQGNAGNCNLSILRIGVDTAERPIANANSDSSDYAPTLWRGELAFARTYVKGGRPVVYTKALVAPRSRPSTRQPAVPAQRCSVKAVPGGSCETRAAGVDELELYGSRLAQIVHYSVSNQVGFLTREVRLVDIRRRSSALVALGSTGEGGQTYLGASFAAGLMSWYRSCFGDPGGCTGASAGAFRYRYTAGTYQHANDPYIGLTGYSLLRDATLQVDGRGELGDTGPDACDDPGTSAQETGCPLVRTGPLDWAAIAASRVK